MNDDTAPLLGKEGGRSYDAVGHNDSLREGKPSCCSGGGCGSSVTEPHHGGPATSLATDEEAKEGSCLGLEGSCCADGSVSDCCARLSVSPDGTATLTCLAIIRPDGSAVDVFDTRGSVRTFRTLSGLLALSFDGSGRHEAAGDGRGKEEGDGGQSRQDRHEARLPVSESMPAECNSGRLRSHLAERGYSLGHWLRYRQGGRRGPHPHQSSAGGSSTTAACRDGRSCSLGRGIYPVRHGGHVDYLVHNSETNELHLEYHCGDCGGVDIHGRFEHVNTRSWVEDGPVGGRRRVDLHVYEVPTGRPFRLLDVLEGLFELESQRVGTVRHLVLTPSSSREDLGAGTAAGRGRVGKSQFHVRHICCASEVPQVKSIVEPLEGVISVRVAPTTKTAYVEHDVDSISASDIEAALNAESFGATTKVDGADGLGGPTSIPTDVYVTSSFSIGRASRRALSGFQSALAERRKGGEIRDVRVLGGGIVEVDHNPYYLTASGIVGALGGDVPLAVVSDGGAGGTWAMGSLGAGAGGGDGDSGADDQAAGGVRWTVVLSGVLWLVSMASFYPPLGRARYAALLSVAAGLPPVADKARRTAMRGQLDVNCLMFLAAAGAVALGEYTEAAAVTFLFAISEALEGRATARARDALSAIVQLKPVTANIVNPVTKDLVVVPASAVAEGTTVSVRPGDKVPCDGVVLEGKSTVDESSLTGESRPVSKGPGSAVSGGTVNSGAAELVVRTTSTTNDSAVARLIRLMEEAQSNRSETEQLVDEFARVYTPVVVILALLMCTVPWVWGAEAGRAWSMNGLVMLVIACPCALIISTPVTYVAAGAAASQRGVLIKGGQHLEGLGRVKNICFDKTGTLTRGVFELLHFRGTGRRMDREGALGYLALVEKRAGHPLAEAIVRGAASEGVPLPSARVEDHTLLAGEGITALVGGKRVHAGNRRLFRRLGLYNALPDDVKKTTDSWADAGGTIGFVSVDGHIVGAYCVADRVRDESSRVVKSFQDHGVEITMLTGDQHAAATGIGTEVGLEDYDIMSELLPEDKLIEIESRVNDAHMNRQCCRAKGTIIMVGDGVNDAPALAIADVSVAMGQGAALAMESADVTLLDSNLEKLSYVVGLGRRVIRTIVENVVFSLVVKALVMWYTFVGKSSLWLAIGSDVGAMLCVTLNGMKLLPPPSTKDAKAELTSETA